LLTPKVRRFYCLSQQRRITPEILDLACPHANDSIVGREDPADWPFRNLNELWNPRCCSALKPAALMAICDNRPLV
jgi:hypothetical protein